VDIGVIRAGFRGKPAFLQRIAVREQSPDSDKRQDPAICWSYTKEFSGHGSKPHPADRRGEFQSVLVRQMTFPAEVH
jgi:hypothetical protein